MCSLKDNVNEKKFAKLLVKGKVEPHRFFILVKALVNNVMAEDQVVCFKPGDFLHLFNSLS